MKSVVAKILHKSTMIGHVRGPVKKINKICPEYEGLEPSSDDVTKKNLIYFSWV